MYIEMPKDTTVKPKKKTDKKKPAKKPVKKPETKQKQKQHQKQTVVVNVTQPARRRATKAKAPVAPTRVFRVNEPPVQPLIQQQPHPVVGNLSSAIRTPVRTPVEPEPEPEPEPAKKVAGRGRPKKHQTEEERKKAQREAQQRFKTREAERMEEAGKRLDIQRRELQNYEILEQERMRDEEAYRRARNQIDRDAIIRDERETNLGMTSLI